MTQGVDCGSGVRLERNVRCAMRDGTVLVSDHYYPSGEGTHPTLLVRQPYGKEIATTVVYAHPVWFARHGYNVVIQDVRGRGGSAGEFYPFRNEGRDGFDTIEWLARRPECNGQVGMYGFSYQGLTQLLAAAERPPSLKVMAPAMTAVDLFNGWFYFNGALRLSSTLSWGIQMLREDARRLGLRDASRALERAWVNVRNESLHAPYGECPVISNYVVDWIRHNSPGEYWSSQDVSEKLSQITIPALHVSGWNDTYLKGSVDGFDALRAIAPDQYLIAGPWIHIPWGRRVGDQDFGPEAELDTDAILLRWFNHWLKGSGEFSGEPPIRHFVIGRNEWRSASRWGSGELIFYLQSDGNANSSKGAGVLTGELPESDQGRDIFVYDPEVPVLAPAGSDQSILEQGNNLLVYTTAPLENAIDVLGRPKLCLHASSSALQTDFVGKLIHVSKNNRATLVSVGVARSQYLFPEYKADRIHCWEFEFEPISVHFPAGDRVRLEIASSAFPLFDRNPGNDTHPADADHWTWIRSTQMILHDAKHPSCLIVPVP
ncbi:MAG TPA: CocE/NonD family hydrolase [Chthoniobacterales bacterium]